ncbi:MAG: pyridoxine 5'-phosphate synthase [Gammaproteobacteria bacterium]|nr:pyridoxine 5'-phosphate synthase [Gammaproteobacteria bacterium]
MINPKNIHLGVNVDHIATIREARKTPYPDVVEAALIAEQAGADSITVHLREDRRHIQDLDVRKLIRKLTTHLNLEMAVTEEMLAFALEIQPSDCCLVPEKREELTTEGGLDIVSQFSGVKETVDQLRASGIRVALFIDPEKEQIDASRRAGASVVELHTGAYAEAESPAERQKEFERIKTAAGYARQQGLIVHAGHGLTLDNVGPVAALSEIEELNIGHAIVARALFIGIAAAVKEMKQVINEAEAA